MSDAIVVALIGGAVTIVSMLDRRGHREINKQFSEIRVTLDGHLSDLLAISKSAARAEGKLEGAQEEKDKAI